MTKYQSFKNGLCTTIMAISPILLSAQLVKHDRLLSDSCAIIQKNRKGGASYEDGAAHWDPVYSAPEGEGHRSGAGGTVRGVPPDHPAGH